MKRAALVVPFPDAAILAAYWILRWPAIQDDLQLALAASVLVEAIERGEPVPPDTIDRLLLAGRRRGPVELLRRLAKALVEIEAARFRSALAVKEKTLPERVAERAG